MNIRFEIEFNWICPYCETKNKIYGLNRDEIITMMEENVLDEECSDCGKHFDKLWN